MDIVPSHWAIVKLTADLQDVLSSRAVLPNVAVTPAILWLNSRIEIYTPAIEGLFGFMVDAFNCKPKAELSSTNLRINIAMS